MFFSLGMGGGGNKPKTFTTVRNATPSTVETPNIVWSRRAYFSAQEAGALFTLPPGWQCTFDGTTILTASGEIPEGAKWWRVGAPASSAYSIAVTGTPVLGIPPPTSFDSLTEGQLDALTEEQLDALGA